MKKHTQANSTRSIINLSSTSIFSEGEPTQRSVQKKKKIILTSRRQNRQGDRSFRRNAPDDSNKQNVQNNIVGLSLKKHQKQHVHNNHEVIFEQIILNECRSKPRNMQSQSHFYMESSIDQPITVVNKSKRNTPIRNLASKYYQICNSLIKGFKKIKVTLIRESFKKFKSMIEYESQSVSSFENRFMLQEQQILALANLNIIFKGFNKWISRTAIGNIKRHVAQTSKNQIHLAIEIMKKRDQELSDTSKILSIRMLFFALLKYKVRLQKLFINRFKSKQISEPISQHHKIYSFSNSFNLY